MSREDIPMIEPYNPLDKRNLGVSAATTMLTSPVHMPPPEPFIDAGVYTVYYRGDLVPYKHLVDLNKERYNILIYIGKAVPASARKGGFGMNVDHRFALLNKLSERLGPVSKANNLGERDFMCRYPVVDDIWVPFAESMLIERFKSLWNRCTDGFGNHDPGKGRY